MGRNVDFGSYDGGVWNMVFLGCNNAPASNCGKGSGAPIVNAGPTPSIAEKPFISITSSGTYKLNIPAPRSHAVSYDWSTGKQVDFSDVYVATDAKDTAATINAKLAAGRHVVLAPGIYKLEAPLQLVHDNQVLLGLGLATLVAENDEAAVIVGDVDGARVAGVILEAGPKSKNLLRWGTAGKKHPGSAANPGFLHDVFARVGGPVLSGVSADTMVEINSGHVQGDDLWLWRADHGNGGKIPIGACAAQTALAVNGDDVTMSGLAVEHTLQDMVSWKGDRGATYFFQSEYPYDVDQSWADKGYAAYHVADSVTTHQAYGVGVYHYMEYNTVNIKTGIVCPSHLEASFKSPLAVYLNGNGRMDHIINDKGDATFKNGAGAQVAWYCANGVRDTNATENILV